MNVVLRGVIVLWIAAAASIAGAQPTDYDVDPAHSRITFVVTKWGLVDVEGTVGGLEGTIHLDPQQPGEASTSWRANVRTIRTGEARRDDSLHAPEYFDTTRFPTAFFTSHAARAVGTRLVLDGRLTMRGVTRPLTITVTPLGEREVPDEGRLAVFESTFTINRREFGIVGGTVLGPVISDEVRVSVRAVARRR